MWSLVIMVVLNNTQLDIEKIEGFKSKTKCEEQMKIITDSFSFGNSPFVPIKAVCLEVK